MFHSQHRKYISRTNFATFFCIVLKVMTHTDCASIVTCNMTQTSPHTLWQWLYTQIHNQHESWLYDMHELSVFPVAKRCIHINPTLVFEGPLAVNGRRFYASPSCLTGVIEPAIRTAGVEWASLSDEAATAIERCSNGYWMARQRRLDGGNQTAISS